MIRITEENLANALLIVRVVVSLLKTGKTAGELAEMSSEDLTKFIADAAERAAGEAGVVSARKV